MADTVIGATVLVVVLISVAFYLLPSVIALARKVPNAGSAVVVNIFLGWTFVGWVIALAMALRSQPQRAVMAPPAWGPGIPGSTVPGVTAQHLPSGRQPSLRDVRHDSPSPSAPDREAAE